MTLSRHLALQLGLAACQSLIIVAAMHSRSAGIGAIIGTGVGALVLAARGYRRDRARLKESRELDAKLSATLAAMRRRGITVDSAAVIDVTDEEPRYS